MNREVLPAMMRPVVAFSIAVAFGVAMLIGVTGLALKTFGHESKYTSQLDCADGEVASFDGSHWVCLHAQADGRAEDLTGIIPGSPDNSLNANTYAALSALPHPYACTHFDWIVDVCAVWSGYSCLVTAPPTPCEASPSTGQLYRTVDLQLTATAEHQ